MALHTVVPRRGKPARQLLLLPRKCANAHTGVSVAAPAVLHPAFHTATPSGQGVLPGVRGPDAAGV